MPRVANALTLTVMGVAVWWSGAQRPAPAPQQMARATAVASAERTPPGHARAVGHTANGVTGLVEPALTRTASITPVVYVAGPATASPR